MNEQEYQQNQIRERRPAKKSSWPKTVGIITLIFGILGVLKGLSAIASSFFGEMMAKVSNLPPEFYDKWKPFMLGSGAVDILLGLLLFAGSLVLIFRKRFAMFVLVGWALMKIVFGLVGGVFNFIMQREQMPLVIEQQRKAMEKAGGASGAAGADQVADMVGNATEILSTVMLFVGLAWLMVLPLFILIWFIRPKIRREMADWGSEEG
ncbi:MAG: hypothetical protein QM496_07945 [Verrucomicrobiota bacterium]